MPASGLERWRRFTACNIFILRTVHTVLTWHVAWFGFGFLLSSHCTHLVSSYYYYFPIRFSVVPRKVCLPTILLALGPWKILGSFSRVPASLFPQVPSISLVTASRRHRSRSAVVDSLSHWYMGAGILTWVSQRPVLHAQIASHCHSCCRTCKWAMLRFPRAREWWQLPWGNKVKNMTLIGGGPDWEAADASSLSMAPTTLWAAGSFGGDIQAIYDTYDGVISSLGKLRLIGLYLTRGIYTRQ